MSVNAVQQQVLDNIATYGWHATLVFPTTADRPGTDGFIYTTGLVVTYDHPDIIIFNLPREVGHSILTVVANRVKDGETFEAGHPYHGIVVGYPVAFVPVTRSALREYLRFSHWLHDSRQGPRRPGSARAMQMVWPDFTGRFPWDDGYNANDCQQPVLGETPYELAARTLRELPEGKP